MTPKILSVLKLILILIVTSIFASQFLGAYRTYVRNLAIDGCALSSSYQNQFTDAEGRLVTNREPQKYLYDKCLLDKGIK
jgi:hypothetical protein